MLWFYENVEYSNKTGLCDVRSLLEFIANVRHGHEQPSGRWAIPD